MAENNTNTVREAIQVRYRGRGSQIWVYFGKMLRTFIYQNDWKMLPMAALVAGLVGLVIRLKLFINMEGTLMGAFALACVCIWNGGFNSIQVICRERDVIKREHRSGMHISSYIISHMMYQALICLLQTIITIYITSVIGVQYPESGIFTKWMVVDIGISMFLITYASDMLSLWISALSRTSTTAMTIMPFVLIFQLVFSGSVITLPEWAEPFSMATISSPGLNVIASQADVNNRPFVTISNMLDQMHDAKIQHTVTLGEVLEVLRLSGDPQIESVIDSVKADPEMQEYLGESVTIDTTVGQVMEIVGEKELKEYVEKSASEVSYKTEYENTKDNIIGYWGRLAAFIFVYALLAMITLEFIDKDKR